MDTKGTKVRSFFRLMIITGLHLGRLPHLLSAVFSSFSPLPSSRLARFTGSPMQPYFIFLLLPMFPARTSSERHLYRPTTQQTKTAHAPISSQDNKLNWEKTICVRQYVVNAAKEGETLETWKKAVELAQSRHDQTSTRASKISKAYSSIFERCRNWLLLNERMGPTVPTLSLKLSRLCQEWTEKFLQDSPVWRPIRIVTLGSPSSAKPSLSLPNALQKNQCAQVAPNLGQTWTNMRNMSEHRSIFIISCIQFQSQQVAVHSKKVMTNNKRHGLCALNPSGSLSTEAAFCCASAAAHAATAWSSPVRLFIMHLSIELEHLSDPRFTVFFSEWKMSTSIFSMSTVNELRLKSMSKQCQQTSTEGPVSHLGCSKEREVHLQGFPEFSLLGGHSYGSLCCWLSPTR